jgi:hypothetical protein
MAHTLIDYLIDKRGQVVVLRTGFVKIIKIATDTNSAFILHNGDQVRHEVYAIG